MQTKVTSGSSSRTRFVPVTLSAVPLKIRRRFGQALYEAAVADRDLPLAAELHLAIEAPSNDVHWLPEAAVKKVLNPKPRKEVKK